MRTIRRATRRDTEALCALYEDARAFMRESGNPNQWTAGYPGVADIEDDLSAASLYVCVDEDDVPQAVFFFQEGPDVTYGRIEGAWADDGTYHVVHRIAAKRGTGAGKACLRWACEHARSVRIDTHEDNRPMRHVLRQLGFKECGTIWLKDGRPRIAYQFVSAAD